jgi:hypothetical protein
MIVMTMTTMKEERGRPGVSRGLLFIDLYARLCPHKLLTPQSPTAEDADVLLEDGSTVGSGDEEELVFLGGEGEEEVCALSRSNALLATTPASSDPLSLLPWQFEADPDDDNFVQEFDRVMSDSSRARQQTNVSMTGNLHSLSLEPHRVDPAHSFSSPQRLQLWMWPSHCTCRAKRPSFSKSTSRRQLLAWCSLYSPRRSSSLSLCQWRALLRNACARCRRCVFETSRVLVPFF